MIVKKKGLYLGLLLSMLGVGSAIQAYTVRIRNGTPYTIRFKLDIAVGRDKHGEIGSGHTEKIGVGGQSIRAVEATVYEKPTFIDPTLARRKERTVRAKRYYAPGLKAGGGTWLVTGPYGSGTKTGYIVTREVN